MEEEWAVSLGVNNVLLQVSRQNVERHRAGCQPQSRVCFEFISRLGQGLRRLMKKESSMKMFTDCINNICLEKVGQIPTKRPEEATKYQSRRQGDSATQAGEENTSSAMERGG